MSCTQKTDLMGFNDWPDEGLSELQGGDSGEVGMMPGAHHLRSHSCKGWTSVTVREKESVLWRWWMVRW